MGGVWGGMKSTKKLKNKNYFLWTESTTGFQSSRKIPTHRFQILHAESVLAGAESNWS